MPKVQYYSPKRRAIMKRGDDIPPLHLYEMYDWICHLCKEDIDPMLRFPNKRAATMDHLIPLSRGGTHTWDNVAPAHRDCNEAKADSLTLSPMRGTMAV
jgi:5-methylcytosine-specific restriction endonuclease McrA